MESPDRLDPNAQRWPQRLPAIVWLIGVSSLLRLGFAAGTGLGVDESYMVTAGRVLRLGYFDHPPASWWLSWGAAHLLRTEAPWAVRLPFIALFAVSQWLVWRIGRRMISPAAGLWAAVALNLSPVFGVTTGTWVLPDGPLDTALLGALLCLLHALPAAADKRGAVGWWVGAGLCAGLALFSKYSAVLVIGGAFLYLLASPAHRRWLLRPQPYLGLLAAVAVFCPVLLWNAGHGFASFAFQGDRALGWRVRPWLAVQTLAGEALFVLPWLWLPMMAVLIRGLRRRADWDRRLCAWLAAPAVVGFAAVSAWSSQRVLYHWAAPGYLMLYAPLGGVIAGQIGRRPVRWVLAGSAALELGAVAVLVAQMQFGWLSLPLAAMGAKDPTAAGLDWISVRDDLRGRGLLAPGTVAAALNWRDAGKFGHALGPAAPMLCLCSDARQFGFSVTPGDHAGQDVLLLVAGSAEPGAAQRWFQSVEALAPAAVRLDGQVLMTVTVLRGHHLLPEP